MPAEFTSGEPHAALRRSPSMNALQFGGHPAGGRAAAASLIVHVTVILVPLTALASSSEPYGLRPAGAWASSPRSRHSCS